MNDNRWAMEDSIMSIELESELVRLAEQVVACHLAHDVNGAVAIYDKVDAMLRNLGAIDRLSQWYTRTGALLQDGSDLSDAMILYKHLKKTCLETDNVEGLWAAVVNEAAVLMIDGRRLEALKMAEEALIVARRHGLIDFILAMPEIVEKIQRSEPFGPIVFQSRS
jgi:hypothetical protein